jgi:hypothetical protein
MKRIVPVLLAIACGMGAGAANAAVTFTVGNNPQSDELNVLFGSAQTGTSINGTTNQGNIGVLFTTNTGTLANQGNGQAQLQAGTGEVVNVTISVPGYTFTDLIFNAAHAGGTGSATVTANGSSGSSTFTQTLGPGNGQNYLTILATGGTTLSSVTIDSSGGFDSLQQVRLSGLTSLTGPGPGPGPVPEPETLALLGIGLLGFGAYRRSRQT